MSPNKQFFIEELMKRFKELADIDSNMLSWEEGQIQIELMVKIAECVSRLERKPHHHHHGPRPEMKIQEPIEEEIEELVILDIE